MFSRTVKNSILEPHFGTISESGLIPIEQQMSSRTRLKSTIPKRKRGTIYKPRGSWRRRLTCAFSTTETAAWTANATTTTMANTAARTQFLFEVDVRLRLFLDVAAPFHLKNC